MQPRMVTVKGKRKNWKTCGRLISDEISFCCKRRGEREHQEDCVTFLSWLAIKTQSTTEKARTEETRGRGEVIHLAFDTLSDLM